MATSTITNTITGPTGTAVASCPVEITLMPVPGFRTATDAEVARQVIVVANSSGVWTAALERNADITPANTYYRIVEKIPLSQGGPRTWNIQVGAVSTSLYAALITTPPTVPASTYLTQAAADARYVLAPGSFGSTPSDSRPSDVQTGGVASTYSRQDHKHSREVIYGSAAARAALSGINLYAGLRFCETTTPFLRYFYSGSAWYLEGEQIIARTVLGSANATIDSGTLPVISNGLDLRIVIEAGASSGAGRDFNLRFNSDAAANYFRNFMFSNNSISTAGGNVGANALQVGTGGNESANRFGVADVRVMSYLSARHKLAHALAFDPRSLTVASALTYFGGGVWGSTAAITSVQVVNLTDNWVTGSTITVYANSSLG